MEELTSLSPALIGILVVVWVVEVGLLVWAIVDIVKRPAHLIRGGTKWPWVLVALFINLAGPIIYLVVGRLPEQSAEASAPTVDGATAADAVDSLYGEND